MRKKDRSALFGWVFIIWMILLFIIRITGIFMVLLVLIVPLAVFILVLGNLFWIIKRNQTFKQYLKGHSESHNEFFILLIVCSAKVLAADGQIKPSEIQMVKNFFMLNFGFRDKSLQWVEETLQKELRHNRSAVLLSLEINKHFDYPTKLAMVDFLFRLAGSDSAINENEKKVLNEFIAALGINANDQAFLRARYYTGSSRYSSSSNSKGKGREHYLRILGLVEGVSQVEVKSAYRQLAKKFHPDVVAHLGDDVRLASEKRMKEILEAYEFLKDT